MHKLCQTQWIAIGYKNGLNRYLVLNKTAVNVHNNGQWNGPLPNPEKQILVQISTDKYNTVRLRMYWYVPDHQRTEGAYPPNQTCSPSPQHVQYINDEA